MRNNIPERTGLGTEVKILMAVKGVSRSQLARETDITTAKLKARIDGGKDFKVEELKAVCVALGVTVADLLERTEVAA